jgi:GR25 family glycosyltransferase involved in LPS biosynthesis
LALGELAPGVPAMSELAFFAINLDRTPHRWAEIQRLFGAMPWPLERVAAVDVRNPDEVLAVRGQKLDMPPNGIGWNPLRNRMFALVEEACFASHMLALKAFLASGHDHAVILEDDAVPLDGFAETMRRLLASGIAFDIVKMEGIVRSGGRLSVPVADLGAAKLVRSLRPSSGGAGYLVTRKAAGQLLARAGKLAVPVDDFISNAGLHGCDVMHTSPWLIAQAGADTTMGDLRTPHRHVKRRDPFHFLQQGLVRGRLRIQLWLNAMHGSPLSLFGLYMAPWSPVDVGQQMRRLAVQA